MHLNFQYSITLKQQIKINTASCTVAEIVLGNNFSFDQIEHLEDLFWRAYMYVSNIGLEYEIILRWTWRLYHIHWRIVVKMLGP